MEQHRRDGSIHSEGNSKVDPFEISYWEFEYSDYLFYSRNRCDWSFAFTHASTSSKCILSAIQCLFQLGPFFTLPWHVGWIVSEMIDWLKVRDPALITKIFFHPDIWEEPKSGSSAAGSADHVDGRCKPEI